MNSSIRHRGPDDEGYLLVDNHNDLHVAGGPDTPSSIWESHLAFAPTGKIQEQLGEPSNLALGHRRLSILDLSPAGHQPMSYQNNRYWIVFNGEIYNYRDIKNELCKAGYQFNSNSDTEVVLAAYAEWGQDCLNRLVGMWAFAVYDNKLKEIFLARDRYGIKPLYYWFSPENHFCFASEIKQFTVLNGWQAKLNPQRVYDQLVYSFTDHTDETMFAGVYQLPSGSYYKSSIASIGPAVSGKLHYHKWYSLKREPFKGSFNEAALIFKQLFERSVKEHLNADVPVGTALSGGLDSSSIVCEVNRILRIDGKPELQKTFSSCSVDERFNEKKWMDIVVEKARVDAHFIYPNLSELMEMTPAILWHQDEPYQSQSVFLGYNVFRLANENGVKVLLNGQGADEYLGGYGQFTSARYARMIMQLRLLATLSDIKNTNEVRQIANSEIIRGIAFSLSPTFIRQGITRLTSSSDHVKRVIDIKKLNIIPTHPYNGIPVRYGTVPEISEHLTFYSTLPKYLRWEDRNSMAHSVEARVPFLDHRLVEFSYNLPDDFLEKDGINKRIMREAMKDLLPEKIKNRKDKMGFSTPEEVWVKKENPRFFRQKLSEAVSLTDGIVKPEALTYFDEVVNGKVPFDFTYWRLILFGEWIKRFQIAT